MSRRRRGRGSLAWCIRGTRRRAGSPAGSRSTTRTIRCSRVCSTTAATFIRPPPSSSTCWSATSTWPARFSTACRSTRRCRSRFMERGTTQFGVSPLDGAAVGDPRLGAFVRLYGQPDRDPFSLSLGGYVWIPIGANKDASGRQDRARAARADRGRSHQESHSLRVQPGIPDSRRSRRSASGRAAPAPSCRRRWASPTPTCSGAFRSAPSSCSAR